MEAEVQFSLLHLAVIFNCEPIIDRSVNQSDTGESFGTIHCKKGYWFSRLELIINKEVNCEPSIDKSDSAYTQYKWNPMPLSLNIS
jgi:hypothetical protein